MENNPQEITTWETARGITHTSYNNRLLLVRASVEEVGEFFHQEYAGSLWERDVLGRHVTLGQEGLFLFRLHNHSWTEVLHQYGRSLPRSTLKSNYVEALSQHLGTRVISYMVGDTAGVIGYTLFDRGEVQESFGDSDDGLHFESRIREIAADSISDSWNFPREFFIEQDAFEPGITFHYFLVDNSACGETAHRPGERVLIRNPGFNIVDSEGKSVIERPRFERVDYLALRQ